MAHGTRGFDGDDRGGFNFDNVQRNAMLQSAGLSFKAAMKTGTTISGVVFKGGVVLGADTRSTNGETVADKNCEKIHYIAPNIYCCGAGTAADTEAVTGARRHVAARSLARSRLGFPLSSARFRSFRSSFRSSRSRRAT
jgi:20S proteasome alpha/beta subunit|tara:strand:- start:404 stop:820 length:417 start_codon:yes stop_codon:yes gene_type:complete|eukprot:26189-Pelagococcus_subviridis.AAC.2